MMKKPIMIPVIKNIDPRTVAEEIIGVQPMTANAGAVFNMPLRIRGLKFWKVDHVGEDQRIPDGYQLYMVDEEISQWVEQQPPSMWKHHDAIQNYVNMSGYLISDELMTMFALKWR